VFGSETSGLPDFVLKKIKKRNRLRIPMVQGSRSLNLSNAVAIVTYEALRQNSFQNLL
jgi:tRNA (cytidine/uridine-2'-O-)-methyltransferase